MADKAPSGLGSDGKRVWRTVIADAKEQGLVLDAREALWLENAARVADRIAELEAELSASSFTVPGHGGQPVANPLIGEIRQQRALLGTTLGRLKTDAPADASPMPASNRHRAAALTRWAGAR